MPTSDNRYCRVKINRTTYKTTINGNEVIQKRHQTCVEFNHKKQNLTGFENLLGFHLDSNLV